MKMFKRTAAVLLAVILVTAAVCSLPMTASAYAKPQNSLTVRAESNFFGDSEAYSGYSPLEMWNTRGFTSYICAISKCSLDDVYAFLLETTVHQHPKLVIVEALPTIRKMSADDTLFTEATILFPLFSIHNSWKMMTPERFFSPCGVHLSERQPGLSAG